MHHHDDDAKYIKKIMIIMYIWQTTHQIITKDYQFFFILPLIAGELLMSKRKKIQVDNLFNIVIRLKIIIWVCVCVCVPCRSIFFQVGHTHTLMKNETNVIHMECAIFWLQKYWNFFFRFWFPFRLASWLDREDGQRGWNE